MMPTTAGIPTPGGRQSRSASSGEDTGPGAHLTPVPGVSARRRRSGAPTMRVVGQRRTARRLMYPLTRRLVQVLPRLLRKQGGMPRPNTFTTTSLDDESNLGILFGITMRRPPYDIWTNAMETCDGRRQSRANYREPYRSVGTSVSGCGSQRRHHRTPRCSS